MVDLIVGFIGGLLCGLALALLMFIFVLGEMLEQLRLAIDRINES